MKQLWRYKLRVFLGIMTDKYTTDAINYIITGISKIMVALPLFLRLFYFATARTIQFIILYRNSLQY